VLVGEVLAAGVHVPDLPPATRAARYKALPKERRKIVNALHRAGGTLPVAQLEASSHQMRGLAQAGLVFVVGESAILPLEILYAVPLLETVREGLVDGLRMYPKEGLWAIAAANGVPVDGADEFAVRARLHRHALEGRGLARLNADDLRYLEGVSERAWTEHLPYALDAEEVFRGREAFEEALGRLFLHMAAVPVRMTPGRTHFREVAVPRELRARVEKILSGGLETCRAGKPLEFRGRERPFRSDFLRFLLEVDREPPAITQRATVNQRDLARIARRMGVEAGVVDRLNDVAVEWKLIAGQDGRARLNGVAEDLLSKTPHAFDRAAAGRWRSLRPHLSRGWLAPESHKRAVEAARGALLGAAPRPGSGQGREVCLHCAGEAAAADKAMKKALSGREGLPAGRVARELVEGLARALVDLGFAEEAREGSLVAIRWTEAGERALSEEPVPAAPPGRAVVQPTGEAILPFGLAGGELRAIAAAGEVRSVDQVAVVALTRASVLRAAQLGADPAVLKGLLERRSGGPLPQPVAFLFDELASRMGEVEILPCAAVVRARDPAVLRALGLEAVGEGLGLAPVGADVEELSRRIRKEGYLLATPKAAPALDDLVRRAREEGLPLEVTVEGGRCETILVGSFDGERLAGVGAVGGRRVSIPADAVLSARVLARR
jgi:hypothetical protein